MGCLEDGKYSLGYISLQQKLVFSRCRYSSLGVLYLTDSIISSTVKPQVRDPSFLYFFVADLLSYHDAIVNLRNMEPVLEVLSFLVVVGVNSGVTFNDTVTLLSRGSLFSFLLWGVKHP